MLVNFTDIVLKDIDGNVSISMDFHKVIANLLYNCAKTLDFVDIAMVINKGEAVELTPEQLQEVVKLSQSDKSPIVTFARKALADFVAEQIAENDRQAREDKAKPETEAKSKDKPEDKSETKE